MIKAIIFDCFGVVLTDTFDAAYRSLGGDPDKDRKKIKEILWLSDKGQVRSATMFAEHLGVAESSWLTAVSSGREINQELLDYIQKSLRPQYKVGMLSNVGKGRLPEIFGGGFLDQYFDQIVASGDVGFAKPEARAYEIAAEGLEVRLDECVFTDDRQEYIEGAQSVGMHTILFKDTEQFMRELEGLLA